MFRNYIKIAFRNLRKDGTYTILNVIGLTAAFGVALLLAMFSVFQLSYDRFHEKRDNLFEIYYENATPEGIVSDVSSSEPFAKSLQDEVSGVEKITRFNATGILMTHKDKQLQMSSVYVDPDFFEMFSFPVISGNRDHPISEESNIAITKHAANRIFGRTDVIGETVSILTDGQEVPFVINALVEDFPETSSISFDVVLNFKSQPEHSYGPRTIGRWDVENHEVFMQLSNEVTPKQFEEATTAFTQLHYKDHIDDVKRDGAQPIKDDIYRQIKLLPVTDLRFAEFNQGPVTVSRNMPYLVLGIALLILFVACVNFVNMSIAKSSKRLPEIGMRKTLGAGKQQLFFQFWGESLMVFLVSAGLGLLTAVLLLEPFQTLFRTRASFSVLTNSAVLIGILATALLVTFVAGGYPAWMMSRLETLQSLKGKVESTGKNHLRDGLMVLQFAIAILLISGTLVLWNQVEYMRTKDLGFNKEQVIAFPLNGKRNDQQALQLVRDALESKPNIISVTASNNILGLGKDGTRSTSVLGFEHKGRGVYTNMLVVDGDYPETLDLEVVEGRTFKRNLANDSLSILINEAMAKQLNEKEILNTKIFVEDSVAFTVVGVLKDFNFQELDRTVEPMTLFPLQNWNLRNVYVKVAPQNLAQSYEDVKNAWAEIEPNAEFQGSFLDENINRTLRNERTMTTMIASGSILAIVLSCIGLFAMSMLVVAQRRKEIGIRKVVGASVSTITVLLTKDFFKLVAIGFVIATPLAYWMASEWLQDYAYRIDLGIGVFLMAGGLALLIALATISIRTIRAATANPVRSLRTE